MSMELPELIRGYSNPYLLEQFYAKRDQYTPEALGLMEQEIQRRGIPEEEQLPFRQGRGGVAAPGTGRPQAHSPDEFVAFEGLFSPTDILLVNAVFAEAKIPFYVDNPPSTVFPTESQSASFLTLHVHRDGVGKARGLLSEHFAIEDGTYRVKFSDDRQRLKALNFHELHLADSPLEGDVGVALSVAESQAILTLARRLVAEVDQLEKEQDRIVFFLDNIPDLIDRLASGPSTMLSKTDLFTVTEILQIYCEDPAFPSALNDTVKAVLDFFSSIQ